MTDLRVAPCSHEAAEYAVMHWHYSRRMPVGKLVKFGAWEGGQFVGSVIYGRGANKSLSSPYGLDQTEVCELVRVALTDHQVPVTQVVGATLRRLREVGGTGIRLVVSFADPAEGHHGGIYQAGNWLYLGRTASKTDYVLGDTKLNRRAYTGQQYGKPGSKAALPVGAKPVKVAGKHRYAYPLDRAMRRQLAPLALPYPQPADEGSTGAATPSRVEGQVRSLVSAP